MSGHYIQKKSLFDALFGLKVWMTEIPQNMCQKVVENYFERINACHISRGDHLNNGVFIIKRNIIKNNILYVFYLRLLLKPRNGWPYILLCSSTFKILLTGLRGAYEWYCTEEILFRQYTWWKSHKRWDKGQCPWRHWWNTAVHNR